MMDDAKPQDAGFPDIFDIDPHQLFDEWRGQMRLRWAASRSLADAKAEFERAKARQRVAVAEVELKIRSDPEKYGLDKATEATVKAAVEVHKRTQAANEDVIQARHAMDIVQADLDTISDRRPALSDSVSLYLSDWWAEPRIRKEVSKKWEEVKDRKTVNKGKKGEQPGE